jgi:hypothetical protein
LFLHQQVSHKFVDCSLHFFNFCFCFVGLTVTVTPVPSNTTHSVATPEQSALSHPITVDSQLNPFIRWTSFISLLNSKSSARRSLSDFLEDGSDTSDTDSSEDWDGESQPLEKHHNNQDAIEEIEFLPVNEPTIQIASPNKDEVEEDPIQQSMHAMCAGIRSQIASLRKKQLFYWSYKSSIILNIM